MGYGTNFQDFKCNVHISGRQGPAGIKAVLPRLSQEARNSITIENDENAWGHADSLARTCQMNSPSYLTYTTTGCRDWRIHTSPPTIEYLRVIDSAGEVYALPYIIHTVEKSIYPKTLHTTQCKTSEHY